LTPGVIETLGNQLEQGGLKVFYAGTKKNPFLRFSEMIYKVLRLKRKIDYVLIDTYSTSAFWYAFSVGMICRLFKIRYIPILHGGKLPERIKQSPKSSGILFSNSYRNVAVSGYLKNEFEIAGFETVLIPNNICISDYQFKKRDNPKPKILWVRSFSAHYNPNMAADVLIEILESFPEAELCMVGPGVDHSLLDFRKHLTTKGISQKVRLTGKMSKTDWAKLSEEYDFFINTTNIDNTPISVIEALSLGLLVISTNPGGIPYLLTDNKNACLVSCGDSKKMAEHIKKLIKEKERYQVIVKNGRELAESFDWERIKPLWLELLKEPL